MKHYINARVYAIIFLIIVAGLLCACHSSSSQVFAPPPTPSEPGEPIESPVSEPEQETPSNTVDRVDVIYFHGPQRCTKCLCFEERISYVIATYFQNELDNGKLTFRILDLSEPDNEQVALKYAAVGSQLFINTIIDGEEHIKDIQEIWSLNCTSDEKNFDARVKNVIEQSIEGITE